MTITFRKQGTKLFLDYEQEIGGMDWIESDLIKYGEAKIRKTFRVFVAQEEKNKLIDDVIEGNTHSFQISELRNGYFKLDKALLSIKQDVYFHRDIELDQKFFIAPKSISIFGQIDKLIDEPIYIGGNHEGAIPFSEFETLLAQFPTTTELKHYASSRITNVLKEYLETMTDAEARFDRYMSRQNIMASIRMPSIYEYEIQKYAFIRDRIREMLNSRQKHSESAWQNLMKQFIPLIFPRYVQVLDKVRIKDYESNTHRELDLALVDADGNFDIIEIKTPETPLLTTYRGNFSPCRALAGTIMQAEKYLYHLNKWGKVGETKLSEAYADKLPNNLEIKIANPKALIISGRSNELTRKQKMDFEIIKRKYNNMLDIITYDDLLFRLENIIAKFERLKDEEESDGDTSQSLEPAN